MSKKRFDDFSQPILSWTDPKYNAGWNSHSFYNQYISYSASSANAQLIQSSPGMVTGSAGHSHTAGELTDLHADRRHILAIINRAEDYGQPNYEEDYDWEIVHDSRCEHKIISAYAFDQMEPKLRDEVMGPWRPSLNQDGDAIVYECALAQHVRHYKGIKSLNEDWENLEIGRYYISLFVTKEQAYAYTEGKAVYNPEHGTLGMV